MSSRTLPRTSPAADAWAARAAVAGLIALWGTLWFLLLRERSAGHSTVIACAVLTVVGLSLAGVGLALGTAVAAVANPDPCGRPHGEATARPALALVATRPVDPWGRRVRPDASHPRYAVACRKHVRFRPPG